MERPLPLDETLNRLFSVESRKYLSDHTPVLRILANGCQFQTAPVEALYDLSAMRTGSTPLPVACGIPPAVPYGPDMVPCGC
jgi:hypothetical protein